LIREYAIFPDKAKTGKARVMDTKIVRISDLSGREFESEDLIARLVIEEHPDFPEPITLEVLPAEVEQALPREQNFVRVAYFTPTTRESTPRRFVMSVEDFNSLSQQDDMTVVLNKAFLAQQEERKRGKRTASEGRPRIDYSSPEHAGEPHRGRITDAEKAYVRNNLEEVRVHCKTLTSGS
jgi:hypothetical protein